MLIYLNKFEMKKMCEYETYWKLVLIEILDERYKKKNDTIK
jgi:hypothetical protein